MIRWRTVALVDVPTQDGRVLRGTVTVRGDTRNRVPFFTLDPRGTGHAGLEIAGSVEVRVKGNKIQAMLSHRWVGNANIDVAPGRMEYVHGHPDEPGDFLVERLDPEVVAVTASGPSVWKELRR